MRFRKAFISKHIYFKIIYNIFKKIHPKSTHTFESSFIKNSKVRLYVAEKTLTNNAVSIFK